MGPQINVPLSSVTAGGWKKCFSQTHAQKLTRDKFRTIRDLDCNGKFTLLACRSTTSNILTALAAGPKDDIFSVTDTKLRQNRGHIVHGSRWYVQDQGSATGSWGFARPEDDINLNSCDDKNGQHKLCWHLNDAGWRCGSTQHLTGKSTWEKIVFTSNDY